MAKKVTIKQVAQAAGVSTMTVSRVLNDRRDVAPDTRRHVQQVIDELGYMPSAIARSLIQGRSNTLGVVTSGLEYFGPAQSLTGIEQASHDLGYALLLSLTHYPKLDKNRQMELLNTLRQQQVDGILWAIYETSDSRDWLCNKVQELSVPVVFFNMEPRPNCWSVSMDNYKGGKLVTRHLIEQGRQRIGIITGPADWWEARQRQDGWRDALTEAGLDPNDELVMEGDWSPVSGADALSQLLEQAPDMDGLFVSNDQMALGVLHAAPGLGRKVPDDLAVAGFDDIPEAAFFHPPLTTARQDLRALGRIGVENLVALIETDEDAPLPDEVTVLQPELVVRESSIT